MASYKNSLFWNTIHQIGQVGLTLVSTIVLSRILSPETFGIYAILMIFIYIAEMLADSGIGGYIIKKQDVTEEDYNTLFVYNMTVSILLYFILFFIAPFITQIYNKEILTNCIRIIGIVIIIQSFSITQHQRLLKELKFKTLALAGVSTGFIGLIIAIILALNGSGIWALIFQLLVTKVSYTFVLVCINKHIPSLKFNVAAFKEQFSFGINLMGANMINTISSNLINNFIGKFFSISDAGYFMQAQRLQNYPLNIITAIVDRTFFPKLAKLNSVPQRAIEETHRLRIVAEFITFPIFALIICFAKEIITLVLGPNWSISSEFFQILMTSSFFMMAKAINRNLLKALGFTSSILKIDLFTGIFQISLLFLSILTHSIYMMAWSVVVSQLLSFTFSSFYLQKKCDEGFLLQIATFLKFISVPCLLIVINEWGTDSIGLRLVFSSVLLIIYGVFSKKIIFRLIKR